MSKEIIALYSKIRGNFLWIIATYPDNEESVAIIHRDELGMCNKVWHDLYGDNEEKLKQLYNDKKSES